MCNYAAEYGGNFLSSLNLLAQKLQQKRKTVVFIFPEIAKTRHWEIDLSAFNVLYVAFDFIHLPQAINNAIQPSDHTIIHLHFVSTALLLPLKFAINPHNKIIVHEHMNDGNGLKKIFKGLFRRLFAPRNASYIGVSPYVYHVLCDEVGKKKSWLVTNAIDITRLRGREQMRNNNILIFGFAYHRKGVDLAIKALSHSRIAPNIKLRIVTNDVAGTKDLISNEFALIPNFIEFIPPTQNVEKYYDESFLFLAPSRSESFGYAVVEAAYSGDRVIATDIPGQNMLKDIPGIQWVQPNNYLQLREKIEIAYERYVGKKELNIQRIRAVIKAHYSLTAWVDQILHIYETV